MNACADICHVSAWSRANPPLSYLPLSPSFSVHPPSSVVLLAPKIMLQYFCSAWETVHCWLIHSHSKQKANVWAITHMHTHTLPLFLPVFPPPALPVISAGKSKHFKLSILRVTCGINSARAYECSKVSWRVEEGNWGTSIWFSSGNVVCEKDGKFRIQHKSHCQLCVWQIQKFLLGNMRFSASFVVH